MSVGHRPKLGIGQAILEYFRKLLGIEEIEESVSALVAAVERLQERPQEHRGEPAVIPPTQPSIDLDKVHAKLHAELRAELADALRRIVDLEVQLSAPPPEPKAEEVVGSAKNPLPSVVQQYIKAGWKLYEHSYNKLRLYAKVAGGSGSTSRSDGTIATFKAGDYLTQTFEGYRSAVPKDQFEAVWDEVK